MLKIRVPRNTVAAYVVSHLTLVFCCEINKRDPKVKVGLVDRSQEIKDNNLLIPDLANLS